MLRCVFFLSGHVITSCAITRDPDSFNQNLYSNRTIYHSIAKSLLTKPIQKQTPSGVAIKRYGPSYYI